MGRRTSRHMGKGHRRDWRDRKMRHYADKYKNRAYKRNKKSIFEKLTTTIDNPIHVLYQLEPGVEVSFLSDDPLPGRLFKVVIEINYEKFEGCATSKVRARKAAIMKYLVKYYGMFIDKQYHNLSLATSDNFAEHVNKLYRSLLINSEFKKKEVLSAILITKNEDFYNPTVISLATGNKCAIQRTEDGKILTDCHSEVIAKRGLTLFLMEQLEMLTNKEKKQESIFRKDRNSSKYKLKNGIKFHLYLSMVSCGGARVFPSNFHDHEKSSFQSLRVKVDDGKGTIPLKFKHSLACGYVLSQAQQRSMSCSDKLLKWNYVGIQGCLLTKLIDPIYFKSVVVGSYFKEDPVHSSIYGRLRHFFHNTPPKYCFNEPLINTIINPEPRFVRGSVLHSINWVIGHDVEITNCSSGATHIFEEPSRLARRRFFQKFKNLIYSLGLISYTEKIRYMDYNEVKNDQYYYKKAKTKFYNACEKAGLGQWLSLQAPFNKFFSETT